MKQLLVHVEEDRIETAVLMGGRVLEYHTERAGGQLAGNIYKGRVVNVLPGMQAAFVDIGQGKNAFLYIDDVLHPHLERQPKEKPSISALLRPGQELPVQIVKEPLGGKGARVTTHFSLPGRYLVYMPHADYVGVSKRIGSEQERERLRTAGEAIREAEEGIILRTAAEGVSLEALRKDAAFLRELWRRAEGQAKDAPSPSELHREAGLMHRLVRDMLDMDTDRIWIDDRKALQEALLLIGSMAPSMASKVSLFENDKATLFGSNGVYAQLDRAYAHRIRLESGGDLAWDQTEALTVIDVNTGKYTGTNDLEDTVFRTNMEAAEEIASLLRLRDAGGIIIVDFIDMEDEAHRASVYEKLDQLVRSDRAKCHVVGWTKLGLLELTRKKVRNDTAGQQYETCPSCRGKGRIYTGLTNKR
jgi:ribonuclease G